MSFISDKKKVEMMLEDVQRGIQIQWKNVVYTKVWRGCRKLFVNLKEHHNQGTWISESNNPFRRLSYFLPMEIEGE